MTRESTEALLGAYREAAARHGRLLEEGSSTQCERAYEELTGIRRELRARGPEHLERLRRLLDDEDPAVRRSAAIDALAFAPEDGVRTLREVAAGPPGMVRLDAEMVLSEWEAGRWDTSIP